MKNLLILIQISLMLAHITAHAQEEYFKPGAEWYYSAGYGLLQIRGHSMHKYVGDTVIDNHLLKKVTRTFYSFDLDDPTIPLDTSYNDPMYFKQSGDSILSYEDGEFTLHWIMGLDSGDVFRIDEGWDPTSDWDVYTMIIEQVENVTIDGIDTRKMYIDGGVIIEYGGDTLFTNLSGEEIIYDKFGPESGWWYWVCWGFYDCGPGTLCRYYSDETGRVDINTGTRCETLLTSSKEPDHYQLNIYPNPCMDYIVVEHSGEYSDLTLKIISQTGIQVFNTPIAAQKSVVDISILPPGIFFCRLHGKNGVRVEKIVKE